MRMERLWAALRRTGAGVRLAAGLLAASATAGGAQTADEECQAGEIIMRFSHVVAERGHPKGEAATALAESVNRELQGRACMIVYPQSQLFTDGEVMQALLDGEVEFAAPSLSKLEPYSLSVRVFDLPFLFNDIKAVEWFQNTGPGARLRRSIDEKGFRVLAFWNNGMRQISATQPVLTPSDVRGLTFRVETSELQERSFRQLGADTLALPFREVRPALESGRVDGQMNSWSNILTQGFFEHQDGVTEINHSVLAYVLVSSQEFWRSLPADVRQDLTRIILRISKDVNERAIEIDEDARTALVALGVPVRRVTAEQLAAWREAVRPVWEAYGDEIGWDLIEAAQRANR